MLPKKAVETDQRTSHFRVPQISQGERLQGYRAAMAGSAREKGITRSERGTRIAAIEVKMDVPGLADLEQRVEHCRLELGGRLEGVARFIQLAQGIKYIAQGKVGVSETWVIPGESAEYFSSLVEPIQCVER